MRAIFLSFIAVLALTKGAIAEAPPLISGSNDPAYIAAVETWLAGNDMDALTALSALAQSGNAAAQITLAEIASEASLHTHVTGDLPRKERIALLRQPGGLSGKSWLVAAADVEPLAGALQRADKLEDFADVAGLLWNYGETRDVVLGLSNLINHGKYAEVTELTGAIDDLPPEANLVLRNLAIGLLQSTRPQEEWDAGFADIEKTFPKREASVPWGLFGEPEVRHTPENVAQIEAIVPTVRSFTPISNFCETICTDEADAQACTIDAVETLGLTHGVMPMNSPIDALIFSGDYWRSDRIGQDILRRMGDIELPLANRPQCLVSALAALDNAE